MALDRCRQPVVYGVIGVINTAVHFAVFWCAVTSGASQAVGNALGFTVAVSVSFLLNARFTFRRTPTWRRFLRMYSSMLLVSWGFGWLGDAFELPPWVTFVVYCGINPVIGFVVTKYFVFR